MANYTRADIVKLAQAMEFKTNDPTRHKCFISYHSDDAVEVAGFLSSYGTAFIPRTVGVTADDPFIDSDNDDYIKDQISSKYMSDSTVTILLVGKCSWSRRFVDWELAATLRNSPKNKRSGLLAYQLPSMATIEDKKIPPRLSDNYSLNKDSYSQYYVYPSSTSTVHAHVEEAFKARTEKIDLLDNSRSLRKVSSSCS